MNSHINVHSWFIPPERCVMRARGAATRDAAVASTPPPLQPPAAPHTVSKAYRGCAGCRVWMGGRPRTTCCCRPGPGMEQSIEGNTRKTGSGVACTPRGHFWGHDVKGSMRELLLDAHISISCMEERTVWTALRSGLQGCSAQIGLQGSDTGCTASSS